MSEIKTDFVAGAPRIALDHIGQGPLVLFMHGIGGNRTNWTEQLRACAPYFHAAAWDARGYGLSDDYEGPLDFADFAADIPRVLDHFGVERAHLVGLSMGGRIIQDFYPRCPERVATMVLCDTFPGYDQSFSPEKRAEFVRLRLEPLRAGKTPPEIAPVVARTLVGPNAQPGAYDKLVASMSALHKDSYMKTVEATTHYDRTADLPNIQVPTLLLYGADDTLTPPAIGERMQAEIPDAKLVIIERAGHLSNIEQPEAFNAAMLSFLQAHRDRAQ
jgi:3-oxoadipate enol-lactonase